MNSVQLQKKQTGAFYTPEPLARQLAYEVLKAWQQTHPYTCWKEVRILDPAAGEGGLLIPFAQELAKLRQSQEPQLSSSEILNLVFKHQLFAADISQKALDKIGLPLAHVYHGDALAEQKGRSILENLLPGGVDVILTNPPYIGQKGNAALFNQLRKNPLWASYVTPKNDILYYFFYLALRLLKPNGVAGFITTPYFSTSQGGKLLRQTLKKNASFLRLINFEEKHLFKTAQLHSLLSVFCKNKLKTPCLVGGKEPSTISQDDLFYGPACFLQTRVVNTKNDLLTRMGHAPYQLSDIAQIATGLMTGYDKAFILTQSQKETMPLTSKELAKLKPFFKNSDIHAYAPNCKARLWLIDFFYPNDRDLDVQTYPHLLAHLTQFKEKLLARKQNNNGIDKQLALGKFWFGSVRRKLNFEDEKIILPHRSHTLKAAYSSGPWYASSDVYFITHPKPPYTLWTILGLLNSAPYSAWLQANGKRKGALLELYAAPLKELPIPAIAPHKQVQLEQLTRKIYQQIQEKAPISELQKQLDSIVDACF